MKFDTNNSTISTSLKQDRLFLKIAVCLIVTGFAYRFCFSSYVQISPVVDVYRDHKLPPAPVVDVDRDHKLPPSPSPVVDDLTFSGQIPNNTRIHEGSEKCDVFTGEWVSDPTGPWYTNDSCTTIEDHQNCIKNGRPDSDYIYWRWRPYDCDLPKFDPKAFLHFMRNKSMAFIGDSIARNQVQSLLCILSQVEQAIEVFHDNGYRSRKWFFGSHNFTLSVFWSPFLTKSKIFEDNNGHSSGPIELHLDTLDPVWAHNFTNFDYMIIAGGKWFLKNAIYYENNTIIGCHSCKNENQNISEIGFDYVYRKSLHTVLDFIARSGHDVYLFLRTVTPDHFEFGEWNNGGFCNRTGPFKNGEINIGDIDMVMRGIELEEYGSVNGSGLRLLDTTRLSLLRPDGHPGPYRSFHPFDGKVKVKVQNDCLHWCLPGPIDSWNDLMMNILFRG